MKKTSLTLLMLAGSVVLTGCASTEALRSTRALAEQALTLAQQGNAAAQKAQATADTAVSAAERAQASADAAGAAAASADGKAVAAGEQAAKNDKTFWQHHSRHHPHRR